MKTKDEFSDEGIAEALGCEVDGKFWIRPDRGTGRKAGRTYTYTPDFINNMNAATKYVWPALDKHYHAREHNNERRYTYPNDLLAGIALMILKSPKPALALCEAFWEAKEK